MSFSRWLNVQPKGYSCSGIVCEHFHNNVIRKLISLALFSIWNPKSEKRTCAKKYTSQGIRNASLHPVLQNKAPVLILDES